MKKPKKNTTPPLKTFHVSFTTTGRGYGIVKAATLEEAIAHAKAYEIEGDMQHEWGFDEVDLSSVEEVPDA